MTKRFAIAMAATAAAILPAAASAQTNNPTTVTPFQLTGTYNQNFDTLASTGSTGTALPQGFQISETGGNADGTYAVGTGSSNGGNSYSFGSAGSTDRALGSVGSGNMTQVLFGGVFTNALSGAINSLTFAYTGGQWRLGNSTDDGLTFQYLIGGTNVVNGNWVTVSSLNFAPLFTNGTATGSALDGNLAANQRLLSGTITGLNLLVGQTFAFRWLDVDSTGGDQGLAVDNLSINATTATTAVPEPATWAMMMLGFGALGFAMRRRGSKARVRFA